MERIICITLIPTTGFPEIGSNFGFHSLDVILPSSFGALVLQQITLHDNADDVRDTIACANPTTANPINIQSVMVCSVDSDPKKSLSADITIAPRTEPMMRGMHIHTEITANTMCAMIVHLEG